MDGVGLSRSASPSNPPPAGDAVELKRRDFQQRPGTLRSVADCPGCILRQREQPRRPAAIPVPHQHVPDGDERAAPRAGRCHLPRRRNRRRDRVPPALDPADFGQRFVAFRRPCSAVRRCKRHPSSPANACAMPRSCRSASALITASSAAVIDRIADARARPACGVYGRVDTSAGTAHLAHDPLRKASDRVASALGQAMCRQGGNRQDECARFVAEGWVVQGRRGTVKNQCIACPAAMANIAPH